MSNAAEDSLRLTRVFNAPVHRVYEAWTNAEVIAKWFGPENFKVAHSSIDLKIGGQYRIRLDTGSGVMVEHWGEYVEIVPSSKLVFTWILDNQECAGSIFENANTLVSIEFRDLEGKTEISLLHEKLPSITARDGHEMGWNACLESLGFFLS